MNIKNTENNKEILSQLVDGEWGGLDASEQVEALTSDDNLKGAWSRYHLIRDVMRNESVTIDTDLSSRIMSAIDDEPTYTNVSAITPATKVSSDTNVIGLNSTAASSQAEKATGQSTNSLWKAGLGGFAVAASVALATVIGLNVWQQGAPGVSDGQNVAGTIIPSTAPGIVLPEVEYVSNKGSYWVSSTDSKRSARSEQRLNDLLSNHIESSPTAERTGMLPYSRLVGYDTISTEQ